MTGVDLLAYSEDAIVLWTAKQLLRAYKYVERA